MWGKGKPNLPLVEKVCPKCGKKSTVEVWWRTCLNCFAFSLPVPKPKYELRPQPKAKPVSKVQPIAKAAQPIQYETVVLPLQHEFVRYRMTWHDYRGKHPEGWYWDDRKNNILLGPFDEEDQAHDAGANP